MLKTEALAAPHGVQLLEIDLSEKSGLVVLDTFAKMQGERTLKEAAVPREDGARQEQATIIEVMLALGGAVHVHVRGQWRGSTLRRASSLLTSVANRCTRPSLHSCGRTYTYRSCWRR